MTSDERFRFESQLQRKLMEKINERYGENVWLYKANDNNQVGIPDLIICFYGHFVAIEIKRNPPKKRRALRVGEKRWSEEACAKYDDRDVTPKQRYNIKSINRAQGSAFVGRNTTDIMDKLEKIRLALHHFEAHK